MNLVSEISDMKGTTIGWIKVLLNVFDYITLVVFVMEIIIKWVDGFWVFWRNGWNVFDFFVTAMVGSVCGTEVNLGLKLYVILVL